MKTASPSCLLNSMWLPLVLFIVVGYYVCGLHGSVSLPESCRISRVDVNHMTLVNASYQKGDNRPLLSSK